MKLVKQIIVVMIAFMLLISMSSVGYATDAEDSSIGLSTEKAGWLKEHITGIDYSDGTVIGDEAWIKNYLTTDPDKAAKADGEPIQIGTWDFGSRSGDIYLKKGKSLQQLSHQINQSNDNVAEKVNDVVDRLSTKADLDAAVMAMEGFRPLIDLGTGILVTLITIGMTLFSALDIAYIAFPVVRSAFEDVKNNGGPGTTIKANGERKSMWVTDDAQYAVKKAYMDEGANPWTIYFKKRILSYIMLAIILFILMTGNISLITGIALNLVSGIMNVLSGLA